MGISEYKVNDNVLAIAERIGSFIEYWGFKQIHGKIWTLVFLAPAPVNANYLIQNLKISKALASMSIKELLTFKVLLEVEKDKPGTQKYKINPDITSVILEVIHNREEQMLNQIMDDFQNIKNLKDDNHNPTRIQELGDMISTTQTLLAAMTAGRNVDFNLFENCTQVSEDN